MKPERLPRSLPGPLACSDDCAATTQSVPTAPVCAISCNTAGVAACLASERSTRTALSVVTSDTLIIKAPTAATPAPCATSSARPSAHPHSRSSAPSASSHARRSSSSSSMSTSTGTAPASTALTRLRPHGVAPARTWRAALVAALDTCCLSRSSCTTSRNTCSGRFLLGDNDITFWRSSAACSLDAALDRCRAETSASTNSESFVSMARSRHCSGSWSEQMISSASPSPDATSTANKASATPGTAATSFLLRSLSAATSLSSRSAARSSDDDHLVVLAAAAAAAATRDTSEATRPRSVAGLGGVWMAWAAKEWIAAHEWMRRRSVWLGVGSKSSGTGCLVTGQLPAVRSHRSMPSRS
nr:unnamed protein product [Digitaria exilis]